MDLAEPYVVMAGLGPAIHVSGPYPGKDVDTRDKRGHDDSVNLTCSNRGAAGTSSLGLQGGAGASVT